MTGHVSIQTIQVLLGVEQVKHVSRSGITCQDHVTEDVIPSVVEVSKVVLSEDLITLGQCHGRLSV